MCNDILLQHVQANLRKDKPEISLTVQSPETNSAGKVFHLAPALMRL